MRSITLDRNLQHNSPCSELPASLIIDSSDLSVFFLLRFAIVDDLSCMELSRVSTKSRS